MRKFALLLITAVLYTLLVADLSGCHRKELISPTPFSDTTIVAGSGEAGSADGKGTVATFYHPFGITVDASGNLYIADQGNNTIRKITTDTVVSTLAGIAGTTGIINGKDTATFNKPFSVAADDAGNVYVADAGNNVIRVIDKTGLVSTFAGTGVAGAANGKDTATFNSPLGVAVDKTGNVYVADYGNNLVRKITADGTVSSLAGKSGVSGATNGLDTAATFNLPEGLAVDAAGNVYVADNGNNLIRKITSTGQVTTLAGSGQRGSADGNGTAASFNSPFGIAVDATGNLYVADAGNNRIRKITPDGTVSTFAGSGAKGANNATGASATFNTPAGVAIDAAGNVYVSDENNNLIRKITPAGAVTTFASRPAKFSLKSTR